VLASLASQGFRRRRAGKLLAGTGGSGAPARRRQHRHAACAARSTPSIVKAARQGDGADRGGQDREDLLVGKKGRDPLRRDYPKQIVENFDTSTVRNPGFGGEAIARSWWRCSRPGEFDVAHLIFPSSSR
jgi:F-type H+-transporting ATPase subunit gamma